jgi:hypothetical protein
VRALGAALLLAACQKAVTSEPSPAGSVAAPAGSVAAPTGSGAVARTGSAAVGPAAAPAKAWFEGAWQGTFRAELFRIELPAGGVKEWKNDDGKLGSGDGKLAFEVTPDGTANGSASGALGELVLAGRVEGDRAALTLASPAPDGFHGVILATQSAEGMKGTLNASSADSLRVRRANVTLSRAAP